jgi:tetratricopeptide (TPR) repeat protein
MKKRVVSLLLPALLIPLACTSRSDSLDSQHAALSRTLTGRELLLGLVELDQAHPGSLSLKADLGAVCLSLGDLDLARIYLSAGTRIAEGRRHGRRTDGRLQALIHAGLAELCLRTGDPAGAVRCSDTAISLAPCDPAGARFTRARALAALGRTPQALDDFSAGWERQRDRMLADDYACWAALLGATGSERRALDVLAEMQARFPHRQGAALEQSALYGRLGMLEESILAAYEELEYGLYTGRTTTARVLEGLSELDGKLGSASTGAVRRARLLAAGLARHARGDWKGAAAALSGVSAVSSMPIGRYVLLSSRLEAGEASAGDLAAYAALEDRFRGLGGYYYHLWRGMKASTPAGALPVEVLEKCILLCPGSSACAQSRLELGRALGLGPRDAEQLLLPGEVDAVARAVAAGGEASLLEPVVELLSVPANRYQARAEAALRALARRPDVLSYLRARRAGAEGRLKERLSFLLEG